jgi:uncharacterized protein YceK
MRTLLLLLLLILTGCSSVGTVLPVGGDTYMISSSGHYQSWTALKSLCVERANEFCTKQKKYVSVVNSDTHGVRGWSPQEVEFTFKCLLQPSSEQRPQ